MHREADIEMGFMSVRGFGEGSVARAACKPGPVPTLGHPHAGNGHSSRPWITPGLERTDLETRTDTRGPKASSKTLASGGVYRRPRSPWGRRELLPHAFTLTLGAPRSSEGGLLSVALSLGSPPPDVIRHRMSREPGLSSPAAFRPLPERPSGRLTAYAWAICDGFVKPISRRTPSAENNLSCDVVWSVPRSTGCRRSSRTTGVKQCNIC